MKTVLLFVGLLLLLASPASATSSPPTPTGFTARATHDGCGGNRLAWNPVGAGVIGYEVFLNGRRVAFTPLSNKYFSTAAGTNTWMVRSVDAAHNTSPFSNPVTITIAPYNSIC